jgi:replicative DNA helicase
MNATTDFDAIRTPPHHIESEQAVLGSLLIDNTAIDRIDLAESDFYAADHRLIWKAITSLIDAGTPADAITVADSLNASGELDRVGGLSYMVSLSTNTPSAANIRSYAKTVRKYATRRRLAEAGTRITDLAYSRIDADSAMSQAQAAVMELETTQAATDAMSLRDAVRAMVERVDRVYSGTEVHLKTGFADLDAKIVGLGNGDMIIVAGRPSMGKTAFALQIAERVADSMPVLVFSLEMSAEALAMRQAASIGKVDLMAMRTGQLSDDDWQRLTYATAKLQSKNLYIDDRSGLSLHQIRARARQVKRKHGLGLVVIDYIGLIHGEGENRVNVVAEFSRGIKGMARELGVPVIALSQLNRGLANRPDKRPLMSDLRDSGSIEQDADVVILLHRDDYYNPASEWKGVAECIVAKQRNGPTGIVPLTFIAEYAAFGDFAGRYEPDKPKKPKPKSGFD